jgi:hypothetical protein
MNGQWHRQPDRGDETVQYMIVLSTTYAMLVSVLRASSYFAFGDDKLIN